MTTTASESQTVKFRGVEDLVLVADEWNRGAQAAAGHPTVLLLHGGGQNRFSWKNTGQILADEGFHVVALDSRGHGDSDRSPVGSTRWMRCALTRWPCWNRSGGR